MRTLIFSDSHLGDPRFEDNDFIIDLLKHETYDRLILNGDFADLWLSGFKKISSAPLFKFVAELSKTKEVIWVRGNHDWEITHYLGRPELKNLHIVNRFYTKENNKNILVLHGHQVYGAKYRSWWTKQVAKLVRFVWKYTGFDFQRLVVGTQNKWIQNKAKEKRKEITEMFHEFDWIVIGHTHQVGGCVWPRGELVDVGSVYQTRSYGIIESGKVMLRIIG